MNKKAIVLGATGLVGKQLVKQLLKNELYSEVHILIRSTWPQKHDKLKVHQVDFNHLDNYAALFKVDDIYCCLGTTMAKAGSKEAFYQVDHTYIVSAAKLGRQQGASQFLLISSIGADSHSATFYTKVKGQTEEAVKALAYPSLHIFRPSFLDGDRQENRLGENWGIKLTKWINQLGFLKAYQPVKDHEVARAMCLVAKQNKSGYNHYDNLQIVALGRKTNKQ
jgi:uncharacterized protein YbjT (DUF2867 family)